MSARKTVLASVKVPCDGGESPNAYVPHITAEIRLAFPPNTVTRHEVLEALGDAFFEARRQLCAALPFDGKVIDRG